MFASGQTNLSGDNCSNRSNEALDAAGIRTEASNGTVAQRMDYDEFGRVTRDTNPGFQPFGFAGGLYDPDTGLVRFGARDYDAYSGRWTARDPALFGGGTTNLYEYAHNDPIKYIDVNGKNPIAAVIFILGLGMSLEGDTYGSNNDGFGFVGTLLGFGPLTKMGVCGAAAKPAGKLAQVLSGS